MNSFFERHQTKLIGAMILAGAIALIWLDEQKHRTPVGAAAPNVTFQMLDGSPDVALASLQGQPVVLDFWESWCGPCRQSLPHVNEMAQRLQGRAHVIAVNAGDEPRHLQDGTRNSLKLTLPIAMNGSTAAAAYRVEGLPTTVVLDREGKVVETFVGAVSVSRIERVLEKLQ